MGDRYRTPDGWAVEVVELSATPDRSDGERLNVTYHGSFVAVVRTVAELEQWFALSDLEQEALISCRISYRECAASRGWLHPGHARGARPKLDSARHRPLVQYRLQIPEIRADRPQRRIRWV